MTHIKVGRPKNRFGRAGMNKIQKTAFLLFLCLFAAQPLAGAAEKTVQQGAYTLQRSTNPEKWVTGIAASELVRQRFPGMIIAKERFMGREGRGFTLSREADSQVIKLLLAVYKTTAEAEDTALATLKKSAVTLPAGSKSGRTIGTHSWYEIAPDGSGVVLVVYYNVFFRISAAYYSLAEEQASNIVEDLKHGQHGVQLGKKVVPPDADEIQLSFKPHADGRWQVSHKPASGKKKVAYRVFSSQGSMLRTEEEGAYLYQPATNRPVTFTVFAIDELNVVSSTYTVKKDFD